MGAQTPFIPGAQYIQTDKVCVCVCACDRETTAKRAESLFSIFHVTDWVRVSAAVYRRDTVYKVGLQVSISIQA
jgi:hypothetical protein